MAPAPPHVNLVVQRQSSSAEAGGFPNTLGPISPVPAHYGAMYDSPSPGAVAGIVLGAVAGFLLLLALLWICCAFGPVADTASSWGAPTVSGITLRTRRRGGGDRSPSRSRRRSRSRQRSKHRVSRVSETVEVRTTSRRPSASYQRAAGGEPTYIVDARIPLDHESDTVEGMAMRRDRRMSTGGGSGRPIIAVAPPPPRVIHDSDSEDDEVVVVEEHGRNRRRSTSRRESGAYRDRDSRRYSRQ
jgi:hypothetical protein